MFALMIWNKALAGTGTKLVGKMFFELLTFELVLITVH